MRNYRSSEDVTSKCYLSGHDRNKPRGERGSLGGVRARVARLERSALAYRDRGHTEADNGPRQKFINERIEFSGRLGSLRATRL